MIRNAVGAIVYKGEKFLLVHKTKINTKEGKENIKGEWDFIKGGVKEEDNGLQDSIIRELDEETGSKDYTIIKQFHEKITFSFPIEIRKKIGFNKQETTMFLVEYFGELETLKQKDDEIDEIVFINKNNVMDLLTHPDTKEFFLRNILDGKLRVE
ncbi:MULTISPECIES: NUDIX domain-containing protein [Sutcliffiella]|uniref:Nudix hydrolase domain-containing protein n=1 Tax=Sutcliffiella cohnii TaxID=33932 RepID=A0A223KYN4_9BACI|nr:MULTISPECIES: NUDIX hydrolase [Sutcliffiella]AST94447.1 hypothetical protein BC6307_20935 [Sutcliffiella cohnii]WBL17692.1 NUDIX hydrolase [Sutcliffiella sp. NC1]